jgi:hypothetical protein
MTICFVAKSSADGDSAWGRRIAEAWNTTRDSVIECGRLLIEAKNALPHGAWQRMIETTLPFSASTAQRLMKIAGDERLTNPAHTPQLPPSWATLYELSQLDDGTFFHAVTKGLIRPDMEERLARIEALSARNAPLPVAASGEEMRARQAPTSDDDKYTAPAVQQTAVDRRPRCGACRSVRSG